MQKLLKIFLIVACRSAETNATGHSGHRWQSTLICAYINNAARAVLERRLHAQYYCYVAGIASISTNSNPININVSSVLCAAMSVLLVETNGVRLNAAPLHGVRCGLTVTVLAQALTAPCTRVVRRMRTVFRSLTNREEHALRKTSFGDLRGQAGGNSAGYETQANRRQESRRQALILRSTV